MSAVDSPEPVLRSVSSIRRNGWNEAEANRAVAFLSALVPSVPSSADAALATELFISATAGSERVSAHVNITERGIRIGIQIASIADTIRTIGPRPGRIPAVLAMTPHTTALPRELPFPRSFS